MAAAGVPDIKERLLKGHLGWRQDVRVHIDGYNQLPYLSGEQPESARHEFFYFGERNLFAIRYQNWKVHFEMKDEWFTGSLRRATVPQPVNLRNDPFEQHMQSPNYQDTR